MNEECLICASPLEYLPEAQMMECAICHKVKKSNTRCIKGHYVCDECHSAGMDKVIGICLKSKSKNPFEIVVGMMDESFCHMHGPEHHVMVGASLLTAYKNAGGDIDLEKALYEMYSRGSEVPGGICGLWGSCGAAVSTGIFMSIALGASPLTNESFGLANKMTAKSLSAIGEVGGPRCCKRNSYLSIMAAVDFVKENLGIEMEKIKPVCRHFMNNNQCIGSRCPFSPVNNR